MRSSILILLVLLPLFANAIVDSEPKEKGIFNPEEVLCRIAAISEENPYYLVNVDTPLPYRQYTNDRYLKFQFSEELVSQESWIENERKTVQESRGFSYGDPVTLQLVFHVLHSSDNEAVQEEINQQLEALNRDFGAPVFPEKDIHDPNGHFGELASDTGIRFILSDYAADDASLPGIATLQEVDEQWRDYNAMKSLFPPVDPETTINIWVIKTDEDIGSYAQIPGGPPETDGIVIDSRFFGRGSLTYTEGKTLTHLIGNYLGLIDLWGFYPCTDDGVEDTPIHNAPNLGDPAHVRISTCYGYPPAMLMNFMDNSNDANMYMFTRGQVQRMRYMLSTQGLRPHLSKTP